MNIYFAGIIFGLSFIVGTVLGGSNLELVVRDDAQFNNSLSCWTEGLIPALHIQASKPCCNGSPTTKPGGFSRWSCKANPRQWELDRKVTEVLRSSKGGHTVKDDPYDFIFNIKVVDQVSSAPIKNYLLPLGCTKKSGLNFTWPSEHDVELKNCLSKEFISAFDFQNGKVTTATSDISAGLLTDSLGYVRIKMNRNGSEFPFALVLGPRPDWKCSDGLTTSFAFYGGDIVSLARQRLHKEACKRIYMFEGNKFYLSHGHAPNSYPTNSFGLNNYVNPSYYRHFFFLSNYLIVDRDADSYYHRATHDQVIHDITLKVPRR